MSQESNTSGPKAAKRSAEFFFKSVFSSSTLRRRKGIIFQEQLSLNFRTLTRTVSSII